MDTENTGFTDKQGKPIRVGDTLQIGLGISDRTLKRVIRFGKYFHLVNADETDNKYGGYRLTEQIASLAVIIDRAH